MSSDNWQKLEELIRKYPERLSLVSPPELQQRLEQSDWVEVKSLPAKSPQVTRLIEMLLQKGNVVSVGFRDQKNVQILQQPSKYEISTPEQAPPKNAPVTYVSPQQFWRRIRSWHFIAVAVVLILVVLLIPTVQEEFEEPRGELNALLQARLGDTVPWLTFTRPMLIVGETIPGFTQDLLLEFMPEVQTCPVPSESGQFSVQIRPGPNETQARHLTGELAPESLDCVLNVLKTIRYTEGMASVIVVFFTYEEM